MAKQSEKPIFSLQNVTKDFAGYKALNDVSLEVYPGQVLCLLGDNGAGVSHSSRYSLASTAQPAEQFNGRAKTLTFDLLKMPMTVV